MSNPLPSSLAVRTYLRRRGFESPWYSAASLKRWWFTSFAQPGFAQFWRLWNPPMGILLYMLYRKLGGDQNRILACLGTFAISGLFHDVIKFIVRRGHPLDPELTITFIIFGILVLLTSPRHIQKQLRKVPWPVNVVLNAACLYVGFEGADFIWDYLRAHLG